MGKLNAQEAVWQDNYILWEAIIRAKTFVCPLVTLNCNTILDSDLKDS